MVIILGLPAQQDIRSIPKVKAAIPNPRSQERESVVLKMTEICCHQIFSFHKLDLLIFSYKNVFNSAVFRKIGGKPHHFAVKIEVKIALSRLAVKH